MAQDKLDVRLLGSPVLSWQGQALLAPSQKGLGLVLVLALRPEGMSRLELAELLWASGKSANVRQELYHLRRLPGAAVWLQDSDTVHLHAETDLRRFEEAVTAGRYDEALECWQPLLAGFSLPRAPAFGDLLELERSRVQDLYSAALRAQARVLEQAADFPAALALTAQLVQLDPLDEGAYRSTMRLYYSQGEVVLALETFALCRRVLLEELGVEPLEETWELKRSIQAQAQRTPQLAEGLPLPLLRPPQLVGREEVLARITAAWGAGQATLVCAAAGMGKTRLIHDVARRYGEVVALEGRPGDANMPYSSITRCFRLFLERTQPDLEPSLELELARLLPERFPELAEKVSGSATSVRFIEALLGFITLMRQQACLVVDDLHALDPASFGLFMQSASRDPRALIASYRPEELPAAYAQSLAQLLEQGLAFECSLPPLSVAHIRDLVQALSLPFAEELPEALERYTGGNPLFVLELLRSLQGSGKLTPAALEGHRSERISKLLFARLERLSPTALRCARALALTGAPRDVLADMLELDLWSVTETLAELEGAEILKGERFMHDLLREVVLSHTPQVVQTLLHERAAAAFGQHDPASAARHALQAQRPEEAAALFLRSAEAALRLYRDDDAILFLFRTLWASSDEERRVQALFSLEEIAARCGDTGLQAAALEALRLLAERLQRDGLLFEVTLRHAAACTRAAALAEGLALAEEAAAIAERLGDADLQARAALQLGGAAFHGRDFERARAGFLRASESSDPSVRLRALNNLGVLAGMAGDFATAYRYGQEVLTLTRQEGNLERIAAALNNLGATAERRTAYDAAAASFAEAVTLHVRSHERYHETLSRLNLAEVRTKQGRFAQAWQEASDALTSESAQVHPLLTSRARLTLGTIARQLGALETAKTQLNAALAALEGSELQRHITVVRLNLELCRLIEQPDIALCLDPDALRAEGLAAMLPWFYAEQALFAAQAEGLYEQACAFAPEDNPHLRLLLTAAQQRLRLKAGHDEPLGALTEALTFEAAESTLAYTLLLRTKLSPSEREQWQQQAERLLQQQTEGLALELPTHPLRYWLERAL